MNADRLVSFERCPRLCKWGSDHLESRVKPLSALYRGLEAGLLGEDPRNAVMSLAAQPGLDIEGQETYSIAVHLAYLAEILSSYLMGGSIGGKMGGKWVKDGNCFEVNGELRRIVLLDRWSEDRKMQEIRSWKTMAEVCRRDQPLMLNFLTIGQTSDNRRISAWTRGWTHPRNQGLRFQKKDGGSMGDGWNLQWRERSGYTVDRWLARMQTDGMFNDLVHSVQVKVPRRREEFLRDIERIEKEIRNLPENPPMNRDGCYRFLPCNFVEICHSPYLRTPSECGWIKVSDIVKAPQDLPTYVNVG